jgi:hypothetical protein
VGFVKGRRKLIADRGYEGADDVGEEPEDEEGE